MGAHWVLMCDRKAGAAPDAWSVFGKLPHRRKTMWFACTWLRNTVRTTREPPRISSQFPKTSTEPPRNIYSHLEPSRTTTEPPRTPFKLLVGHSELSNVTEGGSGAAAIGWSGLVRHLIGSWGSYGEKMPL